jgi:Hemerythrin HHE cation binding domain
MPARPEADRGVPVRTPMVQRSRDALDQLRLDHELIRKLLRDHDRLRLGGDGGPEGKAEIVDRLCDALSLFAVMEEDIFFPVLRQALDDSLLAQTRLCDHAHLRRLIARLDEMEPGDLGYDDAVADIADCVLPSMHDAQAVLFVQVRLAGVDTAALGELMAQHRHAQKQDVTCIGLSASQFAGLRSGHRVRRGRLESR